MSSSESKSDSSNEKEFLSEIGGIQKKQMSYRSRNESVISCMQDVENMMQESKKKKKRNKFNRL